MDTSVESNHQKFDVWLFAADIVNFVFLKSIKLPPEVVVGQFPGFVCKGFSETLKTAVQLIRDTIKKDVDEEFTIFQQRNDLNIGAYTKYAKDLRKARFCKGFEVETFLRYCVCVAFMAYRFYHVGVRKAQISAVFCIAEDLQDYGLNYGLWKAFNEIAEEIVGGIEGSNKVPLHRSLSHGTTTKSTDYFTSPEFYHEERGTTSVEKAKANPVGGQVTGTSSKYCSCEGLPKAKLYTRGILTYYCRPMNNRVTNCPTKGPDAMSSLHELLESSMEQLSISSALPFKTLKHEYTSNSTPAESSVNKWKPGTFKRITRKSSLEKQIFKLSPINRIKAENFGFPSYL